MESLSSLIKIQVVNKSLIEKGFANFKKSPKERLTPTYVTSRLESLESQWKDFNQTHKSILIQATESDIASNTYFTKELYDTIEELYFNYKSQLKDHIVKFQGTSSNNSSNSSSKVVSNIRLPKITLPTFSGLYTEWASFRDLFLSLIHKNVALDDVQKLHYLKGHLTGEAEQLLRHTPVTASNYEECWSILVKRYDNKRFLANCMLKRLMTQPNINKETASNIKSLLDNTVDCLQGLQNLDININSWDAIVIYIIGEKLDCESRKLWETKVSALDDLPTFHEFKTFLESRFRSLEYLDPKAIKSSKPQVVKSFNVTTQQCILCSEDHKLLNCKEFSKKNCNERRDLVRVSNLCFNCLGRNHSVYNCRQKTKCKICKKKHHSLLHLDATVGFSDSNNRLAEDKVVTAAVVTSTASSGEGTNESVGKPICYLGQLDHSLGLLATALVQVESDRNGTVQTFRGLLDQGSQVSLITEAAVQFLGLHKVPTQTGIHRLGDDEGSSVPSRSMVTFKLQSRLDPNYCSYVSAYVMNKLTTNLPQRKIIQVPPSLSNLQLADPSFHTPGKIDLLLGAQVVGEVLLDGLVKGPPGSPVAQKTKLGWIVSGEIQSSAVSRPVCYHTIVQSVDVNDLMRKFWELESEPSVQRILNEEELKCEDFYSKTTKRDSTGRYIVKLPFNTENPKCALGRSSEVIARRRYLNLEKRLVKEPELREQYRAVINEYIQLGHAEVVPPAELDIDAFYLPHHAVVRDDKVTTKVRVVFDASCSGHNGVSLNKELMVGPTLQPDLRQVIMRWRRHPISLVADIVKMYRQVIVSREDADYQRFLWRDKPDAELEHFRLLRVTFGTASAPYLAVRTLQQLAHDEGSNYTLIEDRILKDFYVDDFLSGCESIAEGQQLHQQMNELLSRGGFQLQKWSSSNVDLHCKIQDGPLIENLELKSDAVMKILGLTWDRLTDTFNYTVNLPLLEAPVTKRKVVSDIARLFDPLGWLAPVVITAKIFIQRLWLAGIEWDDELPDQLLKEWITFRNNLYHVQEFKLPRWIRTSKSDVLLELHGFSDASNVAYAAVVYTRCVDPEGNVHVSLVASKTKVAPVKQVSIPRLELCGAVLLSKLLREVSDTLSICKTNVHAWTDSTVVLAWLSSHPSRWKTFVGNRVSDILTFMDRNQWSHVQSKDNPADCASRGINPSECADLVIWTQGPSWLHSAEINYNRRLIEETNLEEKGVLACNVVTKEPDGDSIVDKYSSLRKLTRVIAYCKRFLKFKDKNKTIEVNNFLTHNEVNEALHTCIRLCQLKHFISEIEMLKAKGKLDKAGVLNSLNPYIDKDQLLRVGGRLHKANLHEDAKHPIIIPHNSHLTNLLIADAHERTLHGGPQLVLNYLRSKYWIINAKRVVRQYVRKCVKCMRYSARAAAPLMGSLPSARVNASRPFLRSGVDYAGPISIRSTKGRGHHATKGYICLFICMATRAIHLEVVSDMTSQAFLAAFKRFTARRGHCQEMWSDNGTTFVGANKELQSLFTRERSGVQADISEWLATNGTTWHFIPPHSPNFGGLWEAGVKSCKHHLKRVVGNNTLTFEEMSTVLAQTEACLNSRPISAISCHPEDPCPLTPGHFLIGEPLLLAPDSNFDTSNISNLRRWQLTQRLVQDFGRKWSREYLVQFHQRNKWTHHKVEPKIGDVVLVMEDDLPPARWLHGLILEKHPGSDKVTRVVSLRCKGTIIKRPVSRLIVLPITT